MRRRSGRGGRRIRHSSVLCERAVRSKHWQYTADGPAERYDGYVQPCRVRGDRGRSARQDKIAFGAPSGFFLSDVSRLSAHVTRNPQTDGSYSSDQREVAVTQSSAQRATQVSCHAIRLTMRWSEQRAVLRLTFGMARTLSLRA